ncbi:MAG: carotenoid oxygenase family protein [Bacteroidota bacterium]
MKEENPQENQVRVPHFPPVQGGTPPNARYQKVPFLPIKKESTHLNLTVEGEIPPQLDGLYVRNGPNHIDEIHPHHHYFSSHGMVHGVRISDKKALWYRNRMVKSGNVPELLGQPDIGGPISHEFDASPNTNVAAFGDKLYATIEAGPNMVELDPYLESVSRSDLQGALTFGFTGHHKVDPVNHDIHGVVYSMVLRGQAQYVRLTPDGKLLNEVKVPLTGATQIHDMSITEHYIIIYDLNVVFDPVLLSQTTLPIRWKGDKPGRVGVLPKDGTSADIRWFEVTPCYVYHAMNAYEAPNGDVVIDVSRYERAAEKDLYGPLGDTLPTIDRWTLPMNGNTARAKEERIVDLALDFPKISPQVEGRAYRYGYSVQATLNPSFEGAVKIDHQTGKVEHQDFNGGKASELTFVPREGATDEDDGWLMGFVFDPEKERSRLVILNGQDFAGEPAASIWIPDNHVPIGTHGGWFPGFGGR